MTTPTRQTMIDHVTEALGAYGDAFAVDAIVDDLIAYHGDIVDLEEVGRDSDGWYDPESPEAQAFWTIVQRHDRKATPSHLSERDSMAEPRPDIPGSRRPYPRP